MVLSIFWPRGEFRSVSLSKFFVAADNGVPSEKASFRHADYRSRSMLSTATGVPDTGVSSIMTMSEGGVEAARVRDMLGVELDNLWLMMMMMT